MHVDGPAESGRGQDSLVADAHPIFRPGGEELQLSLTEELQARQVDGLRIVFLVGDVVGARALLRDLAERPGLELTVFQDGEIHAADLEAGIEYADSPLDGGRVESIREVPRLLTLDHVHVGDREHVTAVRITGRGREFTVFAPEIGMTDVMVIRDADRRTILHHIAELQAEFDPAGRVFGMAIGLVAGEEEKVRILTEQVVEDFRPSARRAAGITGHVGHDDGVLVDRVTAHQALEGSLLAMTYPVGHVLGAIPALDAEVRAPTREDDLGLGRLDPSPIPLELQAYFLGLVGIQRVELGGELQNAGLLGVQGERDDLIARHQHRRCGRTCGGLLLGLRAGTRLPPGAGRQRIETREICAEGLDGFLRWHRGREKDGGQQAKQVTHRKRG